MPVVLSHYQLKPLLRLRASPPGQASVSPDLNLTTVEVEITLDGIRFLTGELVTWAQAEEIVGSENACFLVTGEGIEKIQEFSEFTSRVYTLMPTQRAPTMLISGIPMHRIKDTDPHADTLSKIRAAAPGGRVLDTTMGLGYTAIEAAKLADSVITVELDPAVVEICRRNPWSRGLFDNPKIERRIGDSFDVIQDFGDGVFSRVIHDPPTFSLAGDLYSGEFYAEVYRVLTRSGRLFHYIGDLDSPSGRRVSKGVVRRLGEAGFRRVEPRREAFAVVAYK